MQLTLQQTVDTILHWTASCKNEVHLFGISTAFENCIRNVFESTHGKDVIDKAEAKITGAVALKMIEIEKLGPEEAPVVNGMSAKQVLNDSIHQMD